MIAGTMPDAPHLAVRTNGRTEFRREPYPLPLALPPLRAADGHDVAVEATVTMTLPDTPADHELFADAFLSGRDVVTPDDVRQKLMPALSASAGEFVARLDAATCLRQQAALQTLLVQRCDAVGYGCGLKFGPATSISITSNSWQLAQSRAGADARRLAELDRVAALTAKLAAIGPAYRLPVGEQAALLPTLLASQPGSAIVLATTGQDLMRIETTTSRVVSGFSDDLGGLRCVVRLSDGPARRYAVGAQRGVAVLDEAFNADFSYTIATTSARGFNGVATAGGRVLATHGELGLVAWRAGRHDAPEAIATPGPARLLTALDDRVLLVAGTAVQVFDGHALRPVADGAAVVALINTGDGVAVVRQDGEIAMLDTASLRTVHRFHVEAPAAAAALAVAGLHALLLATPTGVVCVTASGESLGRCDTRPGGQRVLTVAGGQIIGLSADRASVSGWDWASPRTPAWSVNVLARNGHHVTDLLGVVAGPL